MGKRMARLLIVDDEESLCQLLEIAFRREGHDVETASSGEAAKKKIDARIYDLIISDIRMPDLTGMELLEHANFTRSPALFILITAVPDVSTAIEALNLGAYRYVIKTDRLVEELNQVIARGLEEIALREENSNLRRELLRVFAMDKIVGQGRWMQGLLETIRSVAPTQSTILVTGESGTGKELVARALHEASLRREKPFVSINCGAFPETLLESELFGYVKGAFTGADAHKKGIIESASGGTLLLDEIGEMSLSMQVKLLRVLQERKVRPLGGGADVPVDVRLIALTHRDLKAMAAAGEFREDFYYRVSVIPIHVPPLRERREDIELLARHFLGKFANRVGKPLSGFDEDAVARLRDYAWPGNVRELENAVERAVAFAGADDRTIGVAHLPESLRQDEPKAPAPALIPNEGIDFEKRIGEMEREYLLEALQRSNGVRTRAAALLGISYRSFRHYASKYDI
ncbi:MAG: sigma-54-dependent Fis family transcriptional regulator [Acidobacteriota bacterium]|nr:sigma-54-dependent Fis family transcriptional regulator [Acidobacteriota bacterium]